MTEVTNSSRADWAEIALNEFTDKCGTSGDTATDIADLICDLLHLAKREGDVPLDVASHGIGMFSAEDRAGGEPYANDDAHISINYDQRTTDEIRARQA